MTGENFQEEKKIIHILNCEKCGSILLPKHEDTDRMNNPIQWFRCRNGHWVSIRTDINVR